MRCLWGCASYSSSRMWAGNSSLRVCCLWLKHSQELKIGDLSSLAAIPDLQHLSSLRQLSIYGCECLAAIPSPLPSSLQQLFLSELRALRMLPLGDSSVLLQLQQLTLAACDRVAPLPETIGDLAALQQLAITGALRCVISILNGCCWLKHVC
jgi:hypothetical protein